MMFAFLRHYGKVFFEGLTSKELPITTGVLQGDVLAPFIFIIVVDYVTKKSEVGYGFLTHKGKQQESIRKLRNSSTLIERKISDSDFADDIALLENDRKKAQEQIKCGVKQSETHMTNEELYRKVQQRQIIEEIRKRKLKFVGHCLRMPPEEPANIYALYQAKIHERNKIGRPSAQYIEQISKFFTNDNKVKLIPAEITKSAIDKESWNKLITEPKKPGR
ncbi:unnamed protein product [Brachionus calyciflorus]|uniref:Reverse transcriptase domain-containing protein n=1 Tax=Brachionus calyciflorus TaxID=104777 RepID=A0A814L097_9BILA|nr:unnamed protein product [Brachionus calyciflorus]